MDTLLLSVLVVSGLCVVSSADERRYHVVYELKNMTEAQRHCREKYTDLVTIRDKEDLETLNTTLESSKMAASISRAWIGLYVDSWRWSLSNTSFYKPGETEFRRWKSGEPDGKNGEEHCGVAHNRGTWSDLNCRWKRNPICFDVKGPSETFVFINTTMMWTDAQSYCREHHTDLAIARNTEENLKLYNAAPLGAWIGLFRDGWKWSDGSGSSFRNWKPLEPLGVSEDCVSADLSANGQWETLKCDVMSAFICYSVPVAKRVMKVRLTKSSSSLDLNDPVVMEGLLKQLKLKLKAQGLNDDIKLSWKKQADGKVFHKEERKTGKKRRDEL